MLTGPIAETPEQGALCGTVRGILQRHLPSARASEPDAGQGFDPAVRTAFADAGPLGPAAARDLLPGVTRRRVPMAAMARNMIGEALGLPRSH